MSTVSLVWFRQDLRIDDNPALSSAIEKGWKVNLVNKKPFRDRVMPMYSKRSHLKEWVNKIRSESK
mgnify:CR=1 FL=1